MPIMNRLPSQTLTEAWGFTLVELMITVSIAGVLLAIAIPSFKSSISSNRLTTNANEFITALNLARSEAIKRGKQVTVRRKGSTAGSWDSGWDVFVDFNGNGVFNDANTTPCETNADGSLNEDCILRTYAALPTGFTLRVATTTFQDFVAYLPSSLVSSSSTVVAADAFTLCSGTGTGQTRRTITLGPTGRPTVATTTGTCP